MFSRVSNGLYSRILKKEDVEQFETVLTRDRERAKTRVVSAPEGRVVPNDQKISTLPSTDANAEKVS